MSGLTFEDYIFGIEVGAMAGIYERALYGLVVYLLIAVCYR